MSAKELLEQQIKEQGDVVRKLKSAKESKDKVRKLSGLFFVCVIFLLLVI